MNQIDTAANEDNPEAIMGAWQRALAASGLVGGKFYMIYNEQAAVAISDESLAERFKRKKDVDLAEIYNRMDKVSVERAYRISFALETLSDQLENEWLPRIDEVRFQWAKRVAISDIILASFVSVFVMWLALNTYLFANVDLSGLLQDPIQGLVVAGVILAVLLAPHYYFRQLWAGIMMRRLHKEDETGTLARALARNAVFWRPMFAQTPRGWGNGARKRLASVRDQARRAIQKLNDQFAKPAGDSMR